MVAPTTSYPCSTSRAAATELSTPPDMATRTRSGTGEDSRQRPHLRDDARKDLGHPVQLVGRRLPAQAEAERADGEGAGDAHRHQHVRGLDRAGVARGSARRADAGEVEMHQERLGVGAGHAEVEY